MNLSTTLSQYFNIQKSIHDYFGYKEDWRAIPLDDQRSQHWMLLEQPNGQGKVVWSPKTFTERSLTSGTDICSGAIYTQRHLKKWVYRTTDYVMISVDTHCDGNKFLMVFDAQNECTDVSLKKIYYDAWGNL